MRRNPGLGLGRICRLFRLRHMADPFGQSLALLDYGRHRHCPDRFLLGRTGVTCGAGCATGETTPPRAEEHTAEIKELMRNTEAVFCLKKKREKDRQNREKNRDKSK